MMIFRPYKNCDAEFIVTWILNEKVFHQWSANIIGNYPITSQDLNDYYAKQKDNVNFMIFTACDDKGRPVGHMIMRYLDEVHKKLRFGFIIVDNKVRGKGYGKELLLLAKKYAFQFLQVEEITLGVFENNPNAFYCYQAAGFYEVEESKKYIINTEEWKCIEMKCTRY